MSETQTQQPKTRSNFASRMLSKELNTRNKTSGQQLKISPADAAQYANAGAEEAQKESATVS